MPAERARLVHVDEHSRRLIFRHPLVSATVVELSSSSERRRAHRLLAEALVEQPERRAWHLAEATIEPDEAVASLLEQTARRLLGRGDAVAAVAAMLRSADLSPRGADRGRRLAEAAYLGANVTGELRSAPQLLADARNADTEAGGSLEAAVATANLLINGEGDVDTAHRLLVGAIESRSGRSDPTDTALLEALNTLLFICYFGGGRQELWAPFHAAVARLKPAPVLLALCAVLFVDPTRVTPGALDELDALIARLHEETDPDRIVWIGRAAFFVDRSEGCRESHWRVVRDAREGGAVASGIVALAHLSLGGFSTGRWDEAQAMAEEGLELCDAHGYRLLEWPMWFTLALLAAGRGDEGTARSLSGDMIRWAAPRRARTVVLYARHVELLIALGHGEYEQAYEQAAALSPPGVLDSYVPFGLWATLDLVEAAVHTDRHAEAIVHVEAMRTANMGRLSPRLALLAGASEALVALEEDAADLFERALGISGVERWPFELARVRLAYGEHLRRDQAIGEARTQLTAALETFDGLGARPWAARAGNELRATGLSTPHDGGGPESLTPQEHEIAMLAATGLTNKQIGQRLFLSHRTVGAHLYRVFPKLGIRSRAALRDALGSEPPQHPGEHG